MQIKDIKKININLPLILFTVILINYLPLIIPNTFSRESFGVSNLNMLICYIIEIIILGIYFIINFFKNDKKINITKEIKINLILLVITTIILFFVQVYNFIIQEFKFMDILNIGCIFINIFMLYICMINIKSEEKTIYHFFKAIIFFTLVACIINFILYYKNILGIFGIGKYDIRVMIKSFFANRNQFAFILYLALISNIFILKKNKNIFYIFTLIMFLFNLYITMSRTGLLIGIILLGLLFLFSNIKLKIKAIMILGLIIVMLASGLFIYKNKPQIWNKINNTIIRSHEIKTLSGRTSIWEKGIELLKEKPQNILLGVGRFKSLEALENVNGRTFSQFHNIYIDTLVTGGIMEVLYIGFIYFSVIRKVYKSDLEKEYKKMYLAMFITYGIYIALESFGRFSIGASDTICFIFFITVPLLHANSIKNKEQEIAINDN